MLKIHLLTGLAWTKTIEVEGTLQDDLLSLIEEYFEEYGCPVQTFQTEELDEFELETFIPINGGGEWIEGISHVEEVF